MNAEDSWRRGYVFDLKQAYKTSGMRTIVQTKAYGLRSFISPGLPALLRCPLPPAAQHSRLLDLLRCTGGDPNDLRLRSEVSGRPASKGEHNAAVGMSLKLACQGNPGTYVCHQAKVSVSQCERNKFAESSFVDPPKPSNLAKNPN